MDRISGIIQPIRFLQRSLSRKFLGSNAATSDSDFISVSQGKSGMIREDSSLEGRIFPNRAGQMGMKKGAIENLAPILNLVRVESVKLSVSRKVLQEKKRIGKSAFNP